MVTGRCSCGKVSYEIRGEIVNSGVCSCRLCQRATGGVAWPFMATKREDLVIQGEFKEFSRPGGRFCDSCGSTLFERLDNWPELMVVSASTLDDPSHFKPQVQVWTEQAPKWLKLDPSITKFDRGMNSKTTVTDEKQIIFDLEKSLLEATTRKSAAALGELLADNFYEIGASGQVYDKKRVVEELPLEKSNPVYGEIVDFSIDHMLHGLIRANYTLREENRTTRRVSIWQPNQNSYQMVFHHGTVISGG
jgi:hypothetical protein